MQLCQILARALTSATSVVFHIDRFCVSCYCLLLFCCSSLTASYVFGPIGQAALLTNAKQITDDVFTVAANTLAGLVPESTLESGMLFPTISEMKVYKLVLLSNHFLNEGKDPGEFLVTIVGLTMT